MVILYHDGSQNYAGAVSAVGEGFRTGRFRSQTPEGRPFNLEALADSMLAPSAQERLVDLLGRNAEGHLAVAEQMELDRFLTQVDHLTTLKTRARYTLHEQLGARRG